MACGLKNQMSGVRPFKTKRDNGDAGNDASRRDPDIGSSG